MCTRNRTRLQEVFILTRTRHERDGTDPEKFLHWKGQVIRIPKLKLNNAAVVYCIFISAAMKMFIIAGLGQFNGFLGLVLKTRKISVAVHSADNTERRDNRGRSGLSSSFR
jgi:hypothetical protein